MAKKLNNPPLMNAYTAITNPIDLPLDIIINILIRLPFQSLFHLRYVCKSWRSLLSKREISIHFDQVSDKKLKLMRNVDVSHPRYDVICRFKIPVELNSLEFMLLEPVNGILCIIGPILSHVTYVYLWNPLTSEFKSLPKPNVQMGYVSISFGFGFVPSTNDYKVVRVIQHERKCDTRVEIYSLNRGSWRRVGDSCSSSEITGNERDGANFWNSRSHVCEDGYRSGVLTVDLEKEVITEDDHRRKHCRTVTWSHQTDAILLTLPEDDLVLCNNGYRYNYR